MTAFDSTEAEQRLLAVWTDALQNPAIGMEDDLLDSGGDSLVAMTLISSIAAEFGVELEQWELIEAGTPRKVLELIMTSPSLLRPS